MAKSGNQLGYDTGVEMNGNSQLRMNEEEKRMALQAVLTEYSDLRDEIKRRIDQRTHMTSLMITIDGTLAGLAVYSSNLFILGLIPFVSAFCLLHVKASYAVHKRLTWYIRNVVEGQKLPSIIAQTDRLWLSWETFYQHGLTKPQRQIAGRRPLYDLFELSVFIVCGVAVAIQAYLWLDFNTATVILVTYSVLGLVVVWISRMPDPYEEEGSSFQWQTRQDVD